MSTPLPLSVGKADGFSKISQYSVLPRIGVHGGGGGGGGANETTRSLRPAKIRRLYWILECPGNLVMFLKMACG